MSEFKLFPASGKVFVAVSTGLDSMALLHFFLSLRKKKVIQELEVVHVHHGIRKASDLEADFLFRFCQENDLILNYMRLDKPQKNSNFEANARSTRYEFFNNVCEPGSFLATAHHLNDSFEWWLMNRLKSSTTNTLGIPLRNGSIIRPFLCVTKKQIKKYSEVQKLINFEDATNTENTFERNYIRNLIIPQLELRYPKMLKHYALRSQREYEKLSVLKPTPYHEFLYPWGTHFIFECNLPPTTEKLVQALKRISASERGIVSKELFKFKKALQNGKTGPMSFSGGVKLFFNRTELLMTNKKGEQYFAKLDQKLVNEVKNLSFNDASSVKDYLNKRAEGFIMFPGLVISTDSSLQQVIPSIRQQSLLFPKLTQFLIKNGIWFCSGNQLDLAVRKNQSLLERKIFIINLHE